MPNLITFQFESQDIRFVDGKPVANDVAKILGFKDPADAVYRLVKPKNKSVCKTQTIDGKLRDVTVLDTDGVKELLCRSRKSLDKKQKIADYFRIDLSIVTHSNIETETIKIIKNSFAHLPSVPQFFVSGYRIDLYFPVQRIAVECDEFNHQNYNSQEEKARQDCITKLLGCQFIRYNPNKDDFNIGDVINHIMQIIYC